MTTRTRPGLPQPHELTLAIAMAMSAELLDALVYHSLAIADLPGTARLGKQVVR